MELPKKAKELLEMIQTYSELQGSNLAMIPFKSLAEEFTIDELSLAEDDLYKNNIIKSIKTREMTSASLPSCLKDRDEIINNPEFTEALIDFYEYSEWNQFAIKIYEIGNVESAKFLEQESTLVIGSKKIELTPSLNEFELCRAMFKHKPNEWIDWSEIHLEMNGEDIFDYEKEKRTIYDTYLRLNKRIQQETGIKDYVAWRGKTLKRRF